MTSSKVALAIAAAAAVILVAVWLWITGGQDGEDQQAGPGTPATSDETPATGVAVVPRSSVESETSAATEAESASEAKEAETAKPSFDVVRVEPSGETVIAGRAEPGSEVTILDGDTPIGTAQANEAGEFVVLPEQPLKPGSHELSLEATPAPGQEPIGIDKEPNPVQSENVVIVVVPEAEQPSRVASSDGTAESTQTSSTQTPGTSQADTSGKAIAILTPREGSGGSRVLQQSSSDDGIADRDLLLNAIDYDENGRVVISGLGPVGALVIIYLDNRTVGQTRVDEEGRWRLVSVKAVEPGLHSLRVDQVDETGKVVARVETPFARSTVLAMPDDDEFVIVQPGNSLWRIARRRYGRGVQYTLIYEANLNQIRDPDLIYPGQIFAVPTSN